MPEYLTEPVLSYNSLTNATFTRRSTSDRVAGRFAHYVCLPGRAGLSTGGLWNADIS